MLPIYFPPRPQFRDYQCGTQFSSKLSRVLICCFFLSIAAILLFTNARNTNRDKNIINHHTNSHKIDNNNYHHNKSNNTHDFIFPVLLSSVLTPDSITNSTTTQVLQSDIKFYSLLSYLYIPKLTLFWLIGDM